MSGGDSSHMDRRWDGVTMDGASVVSKEAC